MRKPRPATPEPPEQYFALRVGDLRVTRVDRRNYVVAGKKGLNGYYPTLDAAVEAMLRRRLEFHLDRAQVVRLEDFRAMLAEHMERALEEVQRVRLEWLGGCYEVVGEEDAAE